MKFSILYCSIFVLAIFPTGRIFGQSDTAFDGISFAQQIIGKPLSSIKDSLFDGHRNYVRNPVYKKSTVTIFSCSSGDRNILNINSVKFQELGIVVDTTGVIKGIYFHRWYFNKNSTSDKNLFDSEYKSLVAYMAMTIQYDGVRQPIIDEKSYTQEKITWEKEFLKYILTNQQSKKIKKVRPFYDIDLEIFNSQYER